MDNGTTERLYGNYRAQVVNNKDPQKFGRVLVWIPDLMESIEPTQGIWARPANNPLGGRNKAGDSEHHYMGSSLIPKKGAWVWVFFETGNINRPYYFGALDLENTQVLPENQLGSNYEEKWTLIKTHEGRTIMISDDPDDARVEITGKKRKMLQRKQAPTGDTASVTEIDDNMTTILLDERTAKQKLLIRTYKGDFIHIDIDERKLQIYFKEDIEIKTDGKFSLTAKDDINILSTEGDINVESKTKDLNVVTGKNVLTKSGTTTSINAGTSAHVKAGTDLNHLASGNINQDGSMLNDQTGASQAGAEPINTTPADPKGERDT